MTTALKVHLINPNSMDQNSSYLFFEMDEKARFKYKKDISAGIASELFYDITEDYACLETHNQNIHRDIHKILNVEDKYLIVDSDDFEGSLPTANIYTKEEVLKIIEDTESEHCLDYFLKL